jgi:hypothetical protein
MAFRLSRLWGAVRIERADAATLDRLTTQAALADQFRSDVAAAVACPDAFHEFQAEPACLILRFADGRHVVYRWADPRLRRTEVAAGERQTTHLAVGGEKIDVRFDRSASGRIVTLHLTAPRGRATSRRDRQLDIVAATGADVR